MRRSCGRGPCSRLTFAWTEWLCAKTTSGKMAGTNRQPAVITGPRRPPRGGPRSRATLEAQFPEAVGFYLIILAATIIGFAMGFLPINPIQLLVWTAVINGIVAVPIMVLMMLIVTNKTVGPFSGSPFAGLGRLGGDGVDGHDGRRIVVFAAAVDLRTRLPRRDGQTFDHTHLSRTTARSKGSRAAVYRLI